MLTISYFPVPAVMLAIFDIPETSYILPAMSSDLIGKPVLTHYLPGPAII
jgi:hypothetical protein